MGTVTTTADSNLLAFVAEHRQAREHIILKYGVDLHDLLVSPELPEHGHAKAAVELAHIVVSLLDAAGRGTPDAYRLSAYSVALEIVMRPFAPQS